MSDPRQPERRRAERRPILATFSCFAVFPERAMVRVPVQDLSEAGIGFRAEDLADIFPGEPLPIGRELEVRFYLNQTLFVPVRARVVRPTGMEFTAPASKACRALASFLKALEDVARVAEVQA